MKEKNATLLRVCNNIRVARENKGFTQGTLAKALDINRSTYAEYETNRIPTLEIMMRISELTEVPLNTLAYEDLAMDDKPITSTVKKQISTAARLFALTEYSANLGAHLFKKDQQACLDEIAKIAEGYKD